MRLAFSLLTGLWAGFYTASLAVGLWRTKNRRGALVAALLAPVVMFMPVVIEWILLNRA